MSKIKPKYSKNVILNPSNDFIVSIINQEYPMFSSLYKKWAAEIYKQYPLVDKSQIVLIIKAVFEELRDQLILGQEIAISKLFNHMILIANKHKFLNTNLRVKISTPTLMAKDGS